MEPEFDRYADNYRELMRDPIRDAFATGSDFFHARKWRLLRDFFERRGTVTKSSRWLDIGSGKGELLRLGREAFADAAGCDPSAAMIEECLDLPVRLQENPLVLPFPDESFGFVTAVCVYHHVEPKGRAALTAEVRRVLTAGGVFAIIEHNPLNPVTRLIVSRTPVDAHAQLLRAGDAEALLRGAGLTPFEKSYFLYLPERLYRRFSIVEDWLKRIPGGGQYAVYGSKQRGI
jgi:SAM-dependent methyltransferase